MANTNQKLLRAAKEANALIDELFGVDIILADTPIAEQAIRVQNLLAAGIASAKV